MNNHTIKIGFHNGNFGRHQLFDFGIRGTELFKYILVKFHSMPANYDQHIDVEVSTCESQCWGHTTLSIQIRNESSFI